MYMYYASPAPPYQRGVGKGIAGEWAKEYAPCLHGIVPGNKYCRVLMVNSFIVTTPTRPPDNIFYKFNGKKLWKFTIVFPKIILVIKLYITKATYFLSFWIICWKTIVNLHDIYSLNSYKDVSCGLGSLHEWSITNSWKLTHCLTTTEDMNLLI